MIRAEMSNRTCRMSRHGARLEAPPSVRSSPLYLAPTTTSFVRFSITTTSMDVPSPPGGPTEIW